MHGGLKMLIAQIRNKYWVISVSKAIKNIINHCYICFQQTTSKDKNEQRMGPLPKQSISFSPAHYNSIADLCGPFEIKAESIRSAKLYKAYIIIFACKHTRAVHLELVTSASTESFLNALKRYTSRRGMCRTLQLDNGTNFRGSANVLEKEFRKILQSNNKRNY